MHYYILLCITTYYHRTLYTTTKLRSTVKLRSTYSNVLYSLFCLYFKPRVNSAKTIKTVRYRTIRYFDHSNACITSALSKVDGSLNKYKGDILTAPLRCSFPLPRPLPWHDSAVTNIFLTFLHER